MGPMLRYVFFDLYGTLVDIDTDETAPETARAFEQWVAQAHGLLAASREADHPIGPDLFALRPPSHAFGEPDITPLFFDHLAFLLGRRATPDEVRAAAMSFRTCSRRSFGLVPGALETLQALAPHVGLGMISNAQSLFTTPEIAPFGFLDHLRPLVISSDVGVRKPSPQIFWVALSRAGISAGEAMHVGNDPLDDVDGAHESGLQTCLVDDGRARPPGKHRPDLTLPSVGGLAAALGF
jgi:putative hydrolase of the HAD superfamily